MVSLEKSSLYSFDRQFRSTKNINLAGVDEAGRGPLAGPVVAAAVILPVEKDHPQIRDSKTLTEIQREHLYGWIMENSISVETGISFPSEIDQINILQATIKAMKNAVSKLNLDPDLLLIDGNPFSWNGMNSEFIKKGDGKSLSIAAASIIAKVTRDRLMKKYDAIFPEYGFARHKGYGTEQHLDALKEFGATPIHRRSFNPVKNYLPYLKTMKNKDIGRLGEQIAACGVIRSGYEILEMNFNVPGIGEIDLIHKEDEELVFTEVKTLSKPEMYASPEARIDRLKAERIMAAAGQYLEEKGFGENIRFDVISVRFFKQNPRITRLKNGISL